ncbi:hypothetical protein GCM10027416_24210 [Okibacterium endophyticum]
MILWSLPFAIVALFAAGKLFSMPLQAQIAIDSYAGGYYALSADTAGNLLFLNLGERWVPYFDRGTAYAAGGAFTMATDDLSKALELAPEDRQCMVRVNLARAWEQQADVYRDAGYFQGAILLYETAKAVIDDGEEAGCFESEDEERDEQEQQEQEQPEQPEQGGGEPGESDGTNPDATNPGGTNPDEITPHADPGENLDDAGRRVDQKIEDAERLRDGQGGQPGQPGDSDQGDEGPGGDEQQDAVEELREHGDEAEQHKQDQDAEQRGEEGDRGYVEKPW